MSTVHKIGKDAYVATGKTLCAIRSPYQYLYATVMEQVPYATWDRAGKRWTAPKEYLRSMLILYRCTHPGITLDTPLTIPLED